MIRSLERKGILLKGTTKETISQEGELLSKILGLLMRVGLPLMKNALTRLAKSILIPLELTATASATDPAIQKKIYESAMTTLRISNKKMKDIMEIDKRLEESGLLNIKV